MRHDREDLADRVQACDTFAQARATGVPEPHDGDSVGQSASVGNEDRLASLDAHGAALHRRVGAEHDHRGAVGCAGRGDDAAVVDRGEQLHRAVVEERRHADERVTRVEVDDLDVGAGGDGCHHTLLKTTATLWPPKPNELLSAAMSPSRSGRGAPCTMSRATSSSRFSRLAVTGAMR